MKRWVGLGVIADNLINIGHVLARRAAWHLTHTHMIRWARE